MRRTGGHRAHYKSPSNIVPIAEAHQTEREQSRTESAIWEKAKTKAEEELLHLLFIRFSYSFCFSLICLYRSRDILVNALKRKRRRLREQHNEASTP